MRGQDSWLGRPRSYGLDNDLYGLHGCRMARVTKISHKGSEEARNEVPTLLGEAERGRATIIT